MKIKMRPPAGHTRGARRRTAVLSEGIYQLKVVLAGSEPPIWRRIQVPGDFNLASLHHVLQRVMGWEDCHLHEFMINQTSYGSAASSDGLFAPKMLDESNVRLKEVLPPAGKSFQYVYDFGDDWIHEIKVEKISPPEKGASYPRCLEGENACPNEDSGGIYGHYGLLKILQDPGHPDYEDIKEWMGRFDPSFFSLEAVNRRLRRQTGG